MRTTPSFLLAGLLVTAVFLPFPAASAASTVVCSAGVQVGACAVPSLYVLGTTCEYDLGAWSCIVTWGVQMDGSGVLPCISGSTNVNIAFHACGLLGVRHGDQKSIRYYNSGPGFRTVTATGDFCVSTNHLLERCATLAQSHQIPPAPSSPGTGLVDDAVALVGGLIEDGDGILDEVDNSLVELVGQHHVAVYPPRLP